MDNRVTTKRYTMSCSFVFALKRGQKRSLLDSPKTLRVIEAVTIRGHTPKEFPACRRTDAATMMALPAARHQSR